MVENNEIKSFKTFGLVSYIFHGGSLYHTEASPLICSAN